MSCLPPTFAFCRQNVAYRKNEINDTNLLKNLIVVILDYRVSTRYRNVKNIKQFTRGIEISKVNGEIFVKKMSNSAENLSLIIFNLIECITLE